MKFQNIKYVKAKDSLRIDDKGAVAIEAAICIPLLFLLMAMGAEFVRYVSIVDTVARATATTADLLAREESIDSEKLGKYLMFGPKLVDEEGYGTATDISIQSIGRNLAGDYSTNWARSALADENTACSKVTLDQLIAEGFSLEPGRNAIIAEQCHKLSLNFPGTNILVTGQILSAGIYSRAVFQTRYNSLSEDPNE